MPQNPSESEEDNIWICTIIVSCTGRPFVGVKLWLRNQSMDGEFRIFQKIGRLASKVLLLFLKVKWMDIYLGTESLNPPCPFWSNC